MRLRTFALLTAVLLAVPATGWGAEHDPCVEANPARQMSDEGIGLASTLGLAAGRYALPTRAEPTQLVVMFHGHGNDSCGWRNHLRQAAERGAVVVAMDYTGQRDTEETKNYGWFVNEGAADSIAAAKYFLGRFPSITQVFALGISMGGHASGMAVASADAKRADGSPLFDYWVDIEGVNNILEEYAIIRAVAPFNAGADLARREIDEEYGGPLESNPEPFIRGTNVLRAPDMAYLKGAIFVHAVDDGLVPYNQSRDMATALRAAGVKTELYTVLGRGDHEAGTTATAIAAGSGWESPLAGHGWEGSDTQIVIRKGFDQLWALMAGKRLSEYREFVVHGDSLTVPVP